MFDILDLPDHQTLLKLAERYPQLEIPALETWLKLMRLSADCQNDLDRFLAEHELSQRRFFVLILLARNPGGLQVSQLARGTGVSCATMTGVVDGLVKAGQVTRKACTEDRRCFVVKIAAAGMELLDRVLPQHYQRVSGIMAPLDETEREQLRALLTKLGRGLAALEPNGGSQGENDESCGL